MSTLHQIWLGDAMPEKIRAWCSSMKSMAEARGMEYHLADWNEVQQVYADNPVMPLLCKCLDFLPTGTTYALISDWWRLRILADRGGWYADTDFEAKAVPSWEPFADLHMFDEGSSETMLAAGMMVATGKKGQEAASFMAEAAERGLVDALGSTSAEDFARRYIELVRTDLPGRKWSLVHVIGNAVIKAKMLPKLTELGYTVEPIPHSAASNRRYVVQYNKSADLWHRGTGTWVNRNPSYWPDKAKEAAVYDKRETLKNLPAHLRPQGTLQLDVYKARRRRRDNLPLQALRVVLDPPTAAKRLVVFSNVLRGFPDFEVQPGDFCVHCNTAKHLPETLSVPGTMHAILIRHGAGWKWYMPETLNGMKHVAFVNEGSPIWACDWCRQYVNDNPGMSPTTGYMAAQLCRMLEPNKPLFLVGFDPDFSHGTSMWNKHAWKYEGEVYRQQGFVLIKPHSTVRCRLLIGVCSCQKNTDKRAACRETWLSSLPDGVRPVFFTGAPAPEEADVASLPAEDDYDHLPGKVLAFFRYALKHYTFDWLYKCDDDTYAVVKRLLDVCSIDSDFIGDRSVSSGFVSGGAGYFLRRNVVEALVSSARSIPLTGAEDVLITQAVCRHGFRTAESSKLKCDKMTPPTAGNDIASCHDVTPAEMHIFHDLV